MTITEELCTLYAKGAAKRIQKVIGGSVYAEVKAKKDQLLIFWTLDGVQVVVVGKGLIDFASGRCDATKFENKVIRDLKKRREIK